MVNGKAKVDFLTRLGVADAVVDLEETQGLPLSKMIKKLAPKGERPSCAWVAPKGERDPVYRRYGWWP